jgi:ABC-type transport system involved in Fe-S cluster assembly fused permease/ATPase subunit
MENELYKVISWHSKRVTVKYLAYAIVCFLLNVRYNWSFIMILIATITPHLVFSVALSLFKSETTRKQDRLKF